MTLTSFSIRNRDTFRKFKAIALEQNKSVSEILWSFIENTVQKFDGKQPKLDRWSDPDYVPKPDFMEDINTKWIPWLQTLSTQNLELVMEQADRIYTFAAAYRKVDSKSRHKTFFPSYREAAKCT